MTKSTQIGVKPTKRGGKGSRRTSGQPSSPLREVVYIFEREGGRGGGIWWLVLDCGHAVARKRYVSKEDTALVHAMFRPIKFAPKRVQCHYCGSGSDPCDPWILIKAFGGESPS